MLTDDTRHIDRIRRSISDHGVFVQGVLPHAPGGPRWAYTIGNREDGLPELIIVGLESRVAAPILTGIAAGMGEGTVPAESGTRVTGLLTGDLSLRLGAVRPRWATVFAPWVGRYYDLAPDEAAPMLQVIYPDRRGRFWEDPGFDADVDAVQPDLGLVGPTPWRRPYEPRRVAGWPAPEEADLAVLVPVILGGRLEPRVEAVPARRLSADKARLLTPPALADWVTAGARVAVEVDRDPLAGGFGPSTLRARGLERVVRGSPAVHLVWHHGLCDEHLGTVTTAVLDAVGGLGVTGLLVTPGATHVAAPSGTAAKVRSRMRHLARDGLVTPAAPSHQPVTVRDDPRCADHGRP